MSKAVQNRIGIFGGTFDPVHHGHLKIADSFLASNLLDELLVLPTPAPPHKTFKNRTPFSHRFEMLKIAFRHKQEVTVSDLENQLEAPSYTLRTIRHLQARHPSKKFFLCIGEDSLATFHEWWNYEELLQLAPLIVAARPGFKGKRQSDEILDRAIFVDHEQIDLSSTDIREKARKNGTVSSEIVPEAVAEYVSKHELYRS